MTFQTKNKNQKVQGQPTQEERVPIRGFDVAAVSAELQQCADSINKTVGQLEAAKIVSQDILKLEFSI